MWLGLESDSGSSPSGMTQENTLGCKENLATVATVGAGRCLHILLEEGADAACVTAFAISLL